MVNVKYKKNPGNAHSVKFEIYVQTYKQHLIIFAKPLTIFFPDLPLRAFLGITKEQRVGLKV